MRMKRVVVYLDEEQHKRLEWQRWTSISEVGRRAINEFLTRRIADKNRNYNPQQPSGPKALLDETKIGCGAADTIASNHESCQNHLSTFPFFAAPVRGNSPPK